MPNQIRRIGVLTGGGDAPGLNAVIRAVVKSALTCFGWEVVGIQDGFEGLIEPGRTRMIGFDDVRGILPRGGTILGTTNRANPFSYETLVDGQLETADVSDRVIQHARDLQIDALVVIGGDGTLRIAHELSLKGLRVVGVPKTIDNDIPLTDITFGFDTAVNTAMEALDRLHTTAESHHRIMVLEVMGRDAGWIALKAGISGGADVILIPEIPYSLDEIAAKIESRDQRGAKFSIIVVAEGAMPLGGQAVYQPDREIGGVPRLGGAGEAMAAQLRERTHKEVRVTVLGHLQRGGSPTAFDRLLGSRFGAMAVDLVAEGKLDHMVALQGETITAVPIAQAVSGQKFVPLDGDTILTALGLDISLGRSRQEIIAMSHNSQDQGERV
jgi:ATP-dependent phosphofructokinase / diphosphate-dependent phosphofructokinase